MDSNDALDLGDFFWLDIAELAENQTHYTVPQIVTALNATTTLTRLVVDGGPDYEPRPLSQQRVVEPICQCLANLRLQDEDHPLQAVELRYMDSDLIRQFVVAMKRGSIPHVTFHSVKSLPVHFLTDFCHDNSNLKVLKLKGLTLNDGGAADPIGDSVAATINLDKLTLDNVRFSSTLAATNFAHLLAHMSVSALELGKLRPQVVGMDEDLEYDDDSFDEYDDEQSTNRIVSGNKMPSVEQLTLLSECESKDFQAALDAGMASVKRLSVHFYLPLEDDPTGKLESLNAMIRGAVKLNSLNILSCDGNFLRRSPRPFFQALEACASVTEIHVNNDSTEQPELRKLHRFTARNSKLGQFVANPSTFPNAKLLTLMRQFNKCPTGLYLLTRRLPEVFSFAKGYSLFPWIVEPNSTRKLSKRRKFSNEE